MIVENNNPHMELKEHILNALAAQEKGRTLLVDVGRQTPSTLIEVLREFTYSKYIAGGEPRTITPLYYDKSRGEEFPLYCLERDIWGPRRALLRAARELPVALMSMRHLQMDELVYMAWFLNSDIARYDTNAEVEAFCYRQTRQQIQEGLREGPLKLHVYQTGFPPAIIGFYRGLIHELQQYADQVPLLEVIPYYYSPVTQGYRQGTPW